MTDPVDALRHAMNNDLYRLDSISHNLANVNTAGYKRDFAVLSGFETALTAGSPASDAVSMDAAQRRTKVKDFGQGVLKFSGRAFDIALDGPGFFMVSKGGQSYATRTGNLTLGADGKLMTAQGAVIEGENGAVYLEPAPFVIHEDGSIEQNDQILAQLKLVAFDAQHKLIYRGEGLYQYDQGALPRSDTQVRVKQGYQEVSNVKSMDEMVKLIETTRHFEASHQVLRGYDDMLNSAINVLAEF